MTARQFAKAAKQVGVTPLKLDRARRVLVDGKSAREVADADQVTTQVIYGAIRAVCQGQKTKIGYWTSISPLGGKRGE